MASSQYRGLDEVKVSRGNVLETLKENREKHIQEYNDTMAGWEQELREAAFALQDGAESGDLEDLERQIMMLNEIRREEPTSHEEDYNQYIDMLENSLDDVLVLSSHDYARFMRDEWHWKEQFSLTSQKYS